MADPSQPLAPVPAPVAAFRRAAGIVASDAGVPVDEIIRPRGRIARRYRQTAVYLAAVVADHGCRSIARAVGVSQTAVHKTLRLVEDRRDDDPATDARLNRLEEAMQS